MATSHKAEISLWLGTVLFVPVCLAENLSLMIYAMIYIFYLYVWPFFSAQKECNEENKAGLMVLDEKCAMEWRNQRMHD